MARIALVLAACISVACASSHGRRADPPPRRVERLHLWPCAVEGVGRACFCGSARVPEDRASTARGREIDLDVVVVPAKTAPPRPDPVFVLAGGPGEAATDFAADFAKTFARALETRDFVFVDQRGTGSKSPLRCKLTGEGGDLGTLAGGALPEDKLRDCLAHMDARAELYGTSVAVDDLDEVAARLGFDRVDLLGGSYGTRVAQEWMRRHPARVRAAVLDGVAPPDVDFVVAFAPNAQRVLDALFAECAGDDECHGAFPDPRGDFDRALARLRASPVRVSAPVEGSVRAGATLDEGALAMTVRAMLYARDTRALVPALVHAAAAGEDAAIAKYVVRAADVVAHALSVGMYLSVTCAEDLAGVTQAEAQRAAAGTFLGTARVGPLLRACAMWPHAAVNGEFHALLGSDAPALLLSGTMDPATPANWAERVRAQLPHAQSVVVQGEGHGVAETGCVPSVVARFLDAPERPVDTSCVAPVKTHFATSLAGRSGGR